ncbi:MULTISPECIES: glycosyltransferase family 2 protein [Chryseobacterium]|uniref:Glycosyltransferase involved in cell wall biosynthesis n=1 Tax=Chryseobacterium geocarposphaerae TaxID=1416776 RepID=A0ABU1LBH3_9FLAO|nr:MULTISPECIES: glycosyltransferase family 2 protein [Chryseobacterium]MDR6404078.1 glycosyltransferase involved in cell wall biosynthesis [Chryseobacterium geocarposphaerae]MDR6698403.1 glycosyltransferase involved in cell wall biosynthesis [Chryseobacterium ginsenosidimutans]
MKISVIIPVYNAEKYITYAVESALQFDEVWEVILIEDKSPDNALQVCKSLADKYSKVKLFQHPDKNNHGPGESRNLGILKSTGDFIAFLDADDYYLPNRFDAENVLFKYPEIEGVYGALGVEYYSEKARKQYYTIFKNHLTTVYKRHPPSDIFLGQINMQGRFGLFTLDGLTIRKESLFKIDSLFKPHLGYHEDTEFLIRLSYYLDLYPGILEEAVAIRGVHENNRITKIDAKIINSATTRVLLWKEINEWAEREEGIPEDIKLHIKRMHRSLKLLMLQN